MSEKVELKPCPFCGGKVKLWDYSGFGVIRVIECEACLVRFVFPWNDDIEEHWNRRVKNEETETLGILVG